VEKTQSNGPAFVVLSFPWDMLRQTGLCSPHRHWCAQRPSSSQEVNSPRKPEAQDPKPFQCSMKAYTSAEHKGLK
jgi:hypothetical protein